VRIFVAPIFIEADIQLCANRIALSSPTMSIIDSVRILAPCM
jgi:hypothetical protein